MDMEAGKTLTNEEVIRELLDLLKKNAMKEQANDVFEICSYVDGLEKKIDSMTEELTNMQNQIKEMQEKESYLASFEDIEKNDFNLNIPRYVDNFEKEEDVDINTLLQDMKKTDDELEQVKGDFVSLLKDLTSPDQNIIFSLNDLIRKLEG